MVTATRHRHADPFGDLRNGDCMNQKEFHLLYEQMPEEFRAELINGIVFIAEPVGIEHGDSDINLGTILNLYRARTVGVYAGHNVTVILGKKDEVQPDVLLRILPANGGQSKDVKDGRVTYVQGAPELVAEIAYSSRAVDLHLKRQRYARTGVHEYLVLCLDPKKLYWFDLLHSQDMRPDADGIIRSVVFPGLWIHEVALLQTNCDLVLDVLNEGLKSKEHTDFVKSLAAGREKE
jgi:Uma2 family endonuclease